jgi:hypothetical protein
MTTAETMDSEPALRPAIAGQGMSAMRGRASGNDGTHTIALRAGYILPGLFCWSGGLMPWLLSGILSRP